MDLDWQRDGGSWPLHETSRFVDSGAVRWHVQRLGHGPSLLLLHGTGASTHSWRQLAPLLATRWTVFAVDLPGHGFTRGMPPLGLSLEGMSDAAGALMRQMNLQPVLLIGHSAGAAIAARMVFDRQCDPRAIVSLNGALLRFDSRYHLLFSPLAKLLSSNSIAANLIAWKARDRDAVEHLIASTGSHLDQTGIDLYWRLLRSPQHVAGVLQMMAQWRLDQLMQQLSRLPIPLLQLIGAQDRTMPPSAARRVRELLPTASIVSLPDLGHLAHEERADSVANAVFEAADVWHV
ncbi:MAG: alpha/beta fold hydrolase BchO [Steroidobacteraceae bacterium]|jgi:magnesium chelatase accessory protein